MKTIPALTPDVLLELPSFISRKNIILLHELCNITDVALCGSVASGKWTSDSDIDVCVVESPEVVNFLQTNKFVKIGSTYSNNVNTCNVFRVDGLDVQVVSTVTLFNNRKIVESIVANFDTTGLGKDEKREVFNRVYDLVESYVSTTHMKAIDDLSLASAKVNELEFNTKTCYDLTDTHTATLRESLVNTFAVIGVTLTILVFII